MLRRTTATGRTARRRVLAGILVTAAVTTIAGPPAPATAAPTFHLPFPCNQVWGGNTRANHPTGSHTYYGLDLNRGSGNDDAGAVVVASAAGTAYAKVSSDRGFYVEIDHGGGWSTIYGHLQADSHRAHGISAGGTPVAAGTPIGNVGNTGASKGSHLHYEQDFNGKPVFARFEGAEVTYLNQKGQPNPGNLREGTEEFISKNCGGGSQPSDPTPSGATPVLEASSDRAWDTYPVINATGVAVTGTKLSVVVIDGVRYIYTIDGDGQVWEAASDRQWDNRPVVNGSGVRVTGSQVSVVVINGVRYIYTIGANGQVWEAASDRQWDNRPVINATGVAVTGTKLSVVVIDGVRYIYTIDGNGQVWEAASDRQWDNRPAVNATGVPVTGKEISVVVINGVRYLYTIDGNGQVWEAASDRAWNNYPVINATGIAVTGTKLSVVVIDGVRYIYTIAPTGQVWEAASDRLWDNRPAVNATGVPVTGNEISVVVINGVRYIYTR